MTEVANDSWDNVQLWNTRRDHLPLYRTDRICFGRESGMSGQFSQLSLSCLAGYYASVMIILFATGGLDSWASWAAAAAGALTLGVHCAERDREEDPPR
jgi:hypothetical protein